MSRTTTTFTNTASTFSNTTSAFANTVTTEAELRDLLGTPSDLAAKKVIDHIDPLCRDFISKSPFLLLSTADADGLCDVSPRGDHPGFVLVLDEKRLFLPERPGNRRTDSMRNLLTNPQIGLLFLIPGLEETLRVNGRACLVRDPQLLQQTAVNGRTPQIGIGVEVDEAFVHCAKALKRSHLWHPDTWPAKETLPSPARMLAEHAKLPGVEVEEVKSLLEESYTKRLY